MDAMDAIVIREGTDSRGTLCPRRLTLVQSPLVPISVICGIGFVLCSLLAQLPSASFVSTALLLLYLVAVLFCRPTFFIKYLQVVFAVVSDVVGCLSCEFSAGYLPELEVSGGFYGSAPLLIASRWCFIVVILIYDSLFGVEKDGAMLASRTGDKAQGQGRGVLLFFNITFAAVATLVFLRILPSPSFSLGLDKFQYARKYIYGIWATIDGRLGLFALIPLLGIRAGQYTISLVGLGSYTAYLFWTGNKFGAFFSIACLILFVFYDKLCGIGKARLVRIGAVLAIGILGLVAMTVSIMVVSKGIDPTEYLSDRTAQQGQLWWKVYGSYEPAHGLGELENEVDSLVKGNPDVASNVGSKYGIYRIMYLSARASLIDWKLGTGSRYTEAGFPAAYYYLGVPGVVLFALLGGILTACVTNALIRALCRGGILSSLLLYKLVNTVAMVISMFTFFQLFSRGCLVSYFLLFILARLQKGTHEYDWI